MHIVACRMFPRPGQAPEYRRRHDRIWPELADLPTASGIRDCSSFLDEETHTLFAVLKPMPGHQADARAGPSCGRCSTCRHRAPPTSFSLDPAGATP